MYEMIPLMGFLSEWADLERAFTISWSLGGS